MSSPKTQKFGQPILCRADKQGPTQTLAGIALRLFGFFLFALSLGSLDFCSFYCSWWFKVELQNGRKAPGIIVEEEDEKDCSSFWKREEVTFQVIKFQPCSCCSLTWGHREVPQSLRVSVLLPVK